MPGNTTLRSAALLLMCALGCRAFTLKPMSITLEPQGFGAAKVLYLENESSNRVAFQVSMVTRDMNAEGGETLEPVTNLFSLFPPQGMIAPGEKQSVRLAWRGPSEPTNELCYRVIAEELPVSFTPEAGKAQIKILLRYQGTVYIRPKNAKPDLKVQSFAKTTTNLWRLTVLNAGTAHKNLNNPTLTLIDSAGQKTQIPASQLPAMEGENILPAHTRNFLIDLPVDLKEQAYQVELTVDE